MSHSCLSLCKNQKWSKHFLNQRREIINIPVLRQMLLRIQKRETWSYLGYKFSCSSWYSFRRVQHNPNMEMEMPRAFSGTLSILIKYTVLMSQHWNINLERWEVSILISEIINLVVSAYQTGIEGGEWNEAKEVVRNCQQ